MISLISQVTVNPRDISVVIQGPLFRDTSEGDLCQRCIASIRTHLPGAEIIVSTWQGTSAEGLDLDRLIFSADPGQDNVRNGNFIRQLTSTAAGINAATRPHVLKARADLRLTGHAMTTLVPIAAQLDRRYKLGHSKITTTNLVARDPARYPRVFHPSDIIQFGRREQMADLWSPPSRGNNAVEQRAGMIQGVTTRDVRAKSFVPEQLLMLRWLASHGCSIDIRDGMSLSPQLVAISERFLITNFNVIDWEDSGVDFPARLAAQANEGIYRAKVLREIELQMLNMTYQPRRALDRRRMVFRLLASAEQFSAYHQLLNMLSPSVKTRIKKLLGVYVAENWPGAARE